MSDQYLGEVRVFPFNFAPYGWATCDGQILPISQYAALFSLLGTYYGGNGTSNFGLPNMQGNIPLCFGQGLGLSNYDLGESGGVANVTLLTTEMPSHNHNLMAVEFPLPNSQTPVNGALGSRAGVTNMYTTATSPLAKFAPQAIGSNGGNQPHNNMMPYLTLNFCIALQGAFPPRT
jgi:microcystin-dependent protein